MSIDTPPASSERERNLIGATPKQLFIGGGWRDGSGTIDVSDPSTGEVLCSIADAGPAEAFEALAAADTAQRAFSQTAPRYRSEILRRVYDLMIEREEDLALLITLEMGKTLAEARTEVRYAAEFLRWFSEEAVRVSGTYSPSPDGTSRMLTARAPVGPALLITPWNFPAAMATRKVGPAIAAGCSSVVKPAKHTPLTTLAIAALFEEAELPAGVLNVVCTSDSGASFEPLIGDARARKLSFTGSTKVGRHLLERCAGQVLRVSMELGGNAPFIVCDDADLDAAVEGALVAKLRNNGEACTAANRFLVVGDIADEFAERLTDRMSRLVVGRGTDEQVDLGPLIDDRQVATVEELVDDAVGRGASVAFGGTALGGAGSFYAPTVLTDVSPAARITHEEIFGPVAPIVRCESIEHAIAMANDTPFGLVAYVYTRDLSRALGICERLEVGMVGLNQGVVSNPAAPFGGVKHSGLGREGGTEGIAEFLETRYVAMPAPEAV